MSILTLESQTRFPLEDISKNDAETLELLLLNRKLVDDGQELASEHSYLYKSGAAAIKMALSKFYEIEQTIAVNDGIKIYEAVSSMVRPSIDHTVHNDGIDVNKDVFKLYSQLQTNYFNITTEATDIFVSCLPHTTTVVAEHAQRYRPVLKDYVIIGAALVYELESRRIEAVTLQ